MKHDNPWMQLDVARIIEVVDEIAKSFDMVDERWIAPGKASFLFGTLMGAFTSNDDCVGVTLIAKKYGDTDKLITVFRDGEYEVAERVYYL